MPVVRGRLAQRAHPPAPAGGNGGVSPHAHMAEMQRARLLAAAVDSIEQFGYDGATVARITTRARVSRRTFYEMFANCEECLVAVLEDLLEQINGEMAGAELDGMSWLERVRRGLWAILAFFEREPVLARVFVVQSWRGSETVLQRRAEVLGGLVSTIDEGCPAPRRGSDVPHLTAEGLVGAAHAIVYERLLNRSDEPLTELFAPLMAMIVLPYLGSAAARREQTRPLPVKAQRSTDGDAASSYAGRDPLGGVHMRLTYRTALVLQSIAECPGISNRRVGDRAGISDQGQASKLLTRLERLGLILNEGSGHTKGEANAWELTATGAQVAQSVGANLSGQEAA
jgi:AcrR family transcriptional regulator/DNA-binding MarR family transcriptional regulator